MISNSTRFYFYFYLFIYFFFLKWTQLVFKIKKSGTCMIFLLFLIFNYGLNLLGIVQRHSWARHGWHGPVVLAYFVWYMLRRIYSLLYIYKKRRIQRLRDLGGVWFVFSNNHFQFLNNISSILTHFFTHTYFHKNF